jgi:hypothetical protein
MTTSPLLFKALDGKKVGVLETTRADSCAQETEASISTAANIRRKYEERDIGDGGSEFSNFDLDSQGDQA